MNQPIGDMVSNPNIYKCVFYCFLIAIVEMSLNILMLRHCFLSIRSVVCNHSQMLTRNPASVIIRELSWIFSISVCHVCFDLMRSRFLLLLLLPDLSPISFCSSLHLLLLWVRNVVAHFFPPLLLSRRSMIIVIREIEKFDDRPDNDASVQVYYRLSMRM